MKRQELFVKFVVIFLALCAPLVGSGCLRFTPSRNDIADNHDTLVVNEESFNEFERIQRNRLDGLIAERRSKAEVESPTNYLIGPGDVLQFSVFDVPELSNSTVRVQPSGYIGLPLVGTIKVGGLTEAEVQKEVQNQLSRYVHFPQVNVFISEYEASKVSVIGAVAKPGRYPIKRNDYSLIEILSEAGGRTDNSSGRVLLIPAKSNTATGNLTAANARAKLSQSANIHGIEIYFDDLVGTASTVPISVPLVAGDTIVVPEAGAVDVDGEVKSPGSYKLSSRMTLLGAIASAGGLSYSADASAVEVIREFEAGKKVALSVDLEKLAIAEGKDVRLRDGDIVRVPSSPGRFATRQVIEAINRFLSFSPVR